MQSIDSIEAYAYETSKAFIFKKEIIKGNSMIKQYKNMQLWLYSKRRHKRTLFKLDKNDIKY